MIETAISIKHYFISVCLLFFTIQCIAQEKIHYKNDTSFLYKEVEKNIRVYQIGLRVKHQINDSIGSYKSHGLFRWHIFNRCVLLDLAFTELEIKYPRTGFKIFEVANPDDGLYDFFEKYSSFTESIHNISKFKYLIAYNATTKEIIYISGDFFLNEIVGDFNINNNDKNSFFEYIYIKHYQLKPYDIQFIKEDINYIYFSFMCSFYPKPINIKISKKNMEYIQYVK